MVNINNSGDEETRHEAAQAIISTMQTVLPESDVSIVLEMMGWQTACEHPTMQTAAQYLKREAKKAWAAALEHDGLNESNLVVVFSDDNPHRRRYDSIIRVCMVIGVKMKIDDTRE